LLHHNCNKDFSFTEALKLYRNRLSGFEQSEILDYSEVWFLGLEAKKIEGLQGAAQNNGYDDENGSYIKVGLQFMTTRELNKQQHALNYALTSRSRSSWPCVMHFIVFICCWKNKTGMTF
jgi:hypothetical protein